MKIRHDAPSSPVAARLPFILRRYLTWVPVSLLATGPAQRAGGRTRNLFVKEDSLVEMSTAAFFFAAFLLALALQVGNRGRRILLLALGAVGLAGCLDELSFGQRVFRFTTPRVGRLNLDGFHDLIQITQHSWRDGSASVRTIMLAGAAGVGLLAWRLIRAHSTTIGEWWREHRRHPASAFAIAAAAQVALAMTIDLHFVRFPSISLLEEMLELNGAIALALAIWHLRRATPAPDSVSPAATVGVA